MVLHEMVMPIAAAKQKIIDLSYEYVEHLMKIVIFGDSTNDLYHWEQEIANFISQVNDIIIKPNSKKLTTEFYRDYFFLGQGDNLSDIKLFISIWERKEGKYYPSFDLNDIIYENLLTIMVDFADYFSPILSTKNNHSKNYFFNKILEYFEI